LSEEARKKTEAEILFPEVTVGGQVVRPWPMGTIIALDPEFRGLIARFKESGITYEEFKSIVDGDGQPDLERFYEIFSVVAPVVPAITAKTLSIPLEEAEKIRGDLAIEIALVIFLQNIGVLKNLFGPGRIRRGMENLTEQ